jgi:hypothetical protein
MVRRMLAATLFATATVATAQTPLVPTISGTTLTAPISLPGGLAADLTITFEQAVGLNSSALALSASVVNPLDPAFGARLPQGVSLPAGFPVMLRIDPSAGSALSFAGVYKLSLYTHNLTLTPGLPLRLFRAPSGGAFQDMTGSLEVGSVRAGGSGPGFSDFLILLDGRTLDGVIAGKFDQIEATLAAHGASMPPAVAADLDSRVDTARGQFHAGQTAAAIGTIAAFLDEVKAKSGASIPDVWQAGGAAVNVAGLLRAGGDTLKYSLNVKAALGG